MPFVPVANTALFEFRYTLDAQHIENTLYFLAGSPPGVAELTSLNAAMEAYWHTNLQPLIPDSVELQELVSTDLTTATGPQVSSVPTGTVIGGVADPVLPNNVTLAVSFRTANRGRSFRGRNYIPALWETGVVKNTVGPTIVAAIQAAYNALVTDAGVLAAGFEWVVVSRFSGVDVNGNPIPRVAGLATPVTSALVVDPIIDSARRRLPGRGI